MRPALMERSSTLAGISNLRNQVSGLCRLRLGCEIGEGLKNRLSVVLSDLFLRHLYSGRTPMPYLDDGALTDRERLDVRDDIGFEVTVGSAGRDRAASTSSAPSCVI